ncbi:hypothetical protein [Synechococcus sp. LA31]|uniref:hypothetical protein n=1 Tax=Synechococcus sp. LA31 TaxID=2741953 RepID=UPI001BDC449D|nr:hypothetical protein [Synechococcus sp. LA31]QVV66861.1 hypothetical protein KJJ24_10270 [Synechococcus sp. LA31]
MKAVFGLLFLPVRAPMLLVLLLVSGYMGLHWAEVAPLLLSRAETPLQLELAGPLFWPLQCLQALVVVVVCAMPDLLLRELSQLMAASKALTLVVTLLIVITGGLYLLHLAVLAEVLVLASAVLLARLDLSRLRIAPAPLVGAAGLSSWVLLGIGLGYLLHERVVAVAA